MKNDLVLRVVGKLLIPFILLFGLYVQFHGDFGPGGGFQAGVILASGMLFYGLIFGVDTVRSVVPDWLVETMLASGVLIYAGVGLAGLLLGGNFLDYFVLDHDPIHGQHRGIFCTRLRFCRGFWLLFWLRIDGSEVCLIGHHNRVRTCVLHGGRRCRRLRWQLFSYRLLLSWRWGLGHNSERVRQVLHHRAGNDDAPI